MWDPTVKYEIWSLLIYSTKMKLSNASPLLPSVLMHKETVTNQIQTKGNTVSRYAGSLPRGNRQKLEQTKKS